MSTRLAPLVVLSVAFGGPMTVYAHPTHDGEMSTETMKLRYVLDSLTRKLENRPGQSFDFREYHLRSSLGGAEFDRLERMAESLLNRMKVIEEEAIGSSSVGEVGS